MLRTIDVNPRNFRSLIDAEVSITQDCWAVSIMRKLHSLHTFLIVEGMEGNKSVFRRYEFGLSKKKRYRLLGQKGNIKIRPARCELSERYSTLKKLINPKRKGVTCGFTWTVSRDQAAQLHQAIRRDQSQEGLSYNMLGNRSIANHSSAHNCFTWARERLLDIGIEDCRIAPSKLEVVGAIPSLYLHRVPEEGFIEKVLVVLEGMVAPIIQPLQQTFTLTPYEEAARLNISEAG